MENGDFSFLLLNLPNAPLKCVLRNMKLLHLTAFSILSKRSKELVKCLDIETQEVIVSLGRLVHLAVFSRSSDNLDLCFYTKEHHQIMETENLQSSTVMYTPDFVQARIREDGMLKDYVWKNTGYEIKDWIDHFLSIFNRPKVDKLRFEFGSILFDLDSLHKTINEVREIEMDDRYPVKYNKKICQSFPFAKKLHLRFRTTTNLEEYHNILCQGVDSLTLNPSVTNGSSNWKLDDLLVMNSRSITMYFANLTDKHFNGFFKHWINGSNRRMEHMQVYFPSNISGSKDIFMNGLDYKIIPFEEERLFTYPGSISVIVIGGYDIRRKDGTRATIFIPPDQQEQHFDCFEFFVWP